MKNQNHINHTNLDTIIVGAGPAGMAAAVKLYESGITNILLLERNPYLGGILVQCIHPGFGLEYFKEELTGPEFAMRFISKIKEYKIPYRLSSMVINVGNHSLTVSSKGNGIETLHAESIVFATGCRERTRENLEIPGTRPAGIFTAGLAQTLINIHNYKIGKNVVIQGSGDIGLIMARRLIIEGYNVIAIYERLPYLSGLVRNKVQCLDHFNLPLHLSTEIVEICGKDRVEGVYVKKVNSSEKPEFIECDTILFSVGLIPELELPRKAECSISNNFNPDINSKYEASEDGIFFCGNCLHINDLADTAAREGEAVAKNIVNYLQDYDSFAKDRTDALPYTEQKKNTEFNELFFKKLDTSNKKICIICPKSCLLSENNFTCPRGKKYFEGIITGNKQRMATMSETPDRNPIISKEEIPVSDFAKIKSIIKSCECTKNSDTLSIQNDNAIYQFTKTNILD